MGAEVDLALPRLVRDTLAGADLTTHPGVFLSGGGRGPSASPLHHLERLPVPDFSDFPWDRYPHRIIPVMTGRGCSWGRCTFCSDVITANGRGFRSRPLHAVLDELQEQSGRYRSSDVIFLDIKLNSDVALWRGIIEHMQDRLPGGRWIGTVHVAARGDNGLTGTDLARAYEAGLRRISFGLETGSQGLNDTMDKGTHTAGISEFLSDAHDARISVRTTAMAGYPGETADDVAATASMLERHRDHLDRVRLSRFKAIPGTRFHRLHQRDPARFAGLSHFEWDYRHARAEYRYTASRHASYREAKRRLLRIVHQINRKPLRDGAREFDGLM